MAKDKVILKDNVKRMDKEFIQLNKKISEFKPVISSLEKNYSVFKSIKANSQISKVYYADVQSTVNQTDILNNIANLNETLESLEKLVSEFKTKSKEINNYLEKFRTIRVYKINDDKMIFRFLSGFLDGFAEYFNFKPEFIGVIDMQAVANEVNGKAEGTYVKVPYDKLPKLIEFAYSKRLKNFILESHSLKMNFAKDRSIKIVAESDMIKKIDRLAKESNIDFN